MLHSSLVRVAAAASALLAGAAAAGAQAVRPNAVVSAPAPRPAGVRHGPSPHAVFGTIVSVNGPQLVVQVRDHRLLHVDASEALAAGTYSAPLFVGKVVVVEGAYAAGGVLNAARVSRETKLEGAPPDR